jgi:hypothetical protein
VQAARIDEGDLRAVELDVAADAPEPLLHRADGGRVELPDQPKPPGTPLNGREAVATTSHRELVRSAM